MGRDDETRICQRCGQQLVWSYAALWWVSRGPLSSEYCAGTDRKHRPRSGPPLPRRR